MTKLVFQFNSLNHKCALDSMKIFLWFVAVVLFIISFCAVGTVKAENFIPRITPLKPGKTVITPNDDETRIVIKFHENTHIRLRENSFTAMSDDIDLVAFNDILQINNIEMTRVKRLFTRHEVALDRERAAAQKRSGRELADLNLYYIIKMPDSIDTAYLCDELNSLPIVELAVPAPKPSPLPSSLINPPPITPDFSGQQGYRLAPPGGIGADNISLIPGTDGTGTSVIDIEYNWKFDHEDIGLSPSANIDTATLNDPFPQNEQNHGTAVLGEIGGGNNSFGVTGIVPSATMLVTPANTDEYGYNVARAISLATGVLNQGDAILLEQQMCVCNNACTTGQDGLGPVEYFQANYDAIVTATAAGIIVIEAAGNGDVNLDDASCKGKFDRTVRDSGAIIVGAGEPTTHSRLNFSCYGSRVDVQGWGTSVTTTGYGDLYNNGDIKQRYTSQFGGTSSASPIVTASVLAINGAYKAAGLQPLDSTAMRQLLITTGTPQGAPTSEHIGPLPNLEAALQNLASSGADLSVSKTDTSDPVTVGEQLTYTVTVVNNGPDGATGVTLTDNLPLGTAFVSASITQGNCSETSGTVTCSIGSMENGSTVTATIIVTAPNTAGTITNSATVSSTNSDPNSSNNTSTADTLVSIDRTIPQIDLRTGNGSPGDDVEVPLTLTNITTGTEVSRISVDIKYDTTLLENPTARIGDAAQQAGKNLQINPSLREDVITVLISGNDNAIGNGTVAYVGFHIKNTAPINQTTTLQNTPSAADSSANDLTVTGTDGSITIDDISDEKADLAVTLSESSDPVVPAQQLTYTIGITNNGINLAKNAVLSTVLPSDTIFVSTDITQRSCTETEGSVSCALGDMENSSFVTAAIVVTVPDREVIITTNASVSSDTVDPDSTNNSISEDTYISRLSVIKGTIGTEFTASSLDFVNLNKLKKVFLVQGNIKKNLKILNVNSNSGTVNCVLTKKLQPGEYNVALKIKGSSLTSVNTFSVMPPKINTVNPPSASAGDKVNMTISGSYFGLLKKPKPLLEFKNANGKTKRKACKVKKGDFTMDNESGASVLKTTCKIPKKVSSGVIDVVVKNKVGSDKTTFTIE